MIARLAASVVLVAVLHGSAAAQQGPQPEPFPQRYYQQYPGPPPPAPPPAQREWYGWQCLLSEVLGVGFFVCPVLHAYHGSNEKMLESLGWRSAILGALVITVLYAITDQGDEQLWLTALGLEMIGYLGFVVYDIAALSWKDAPVRAGPWMSGGVGGVGIEVRF
jgi:hypothetical protein